MKTTFGLGCVILLVYCQVVFAKPNIIVLGARRCVNMWDEGCINGQLPGAGGDDDFLNSGFNPGKRCINVWDENCSDGPMATEDNEDSSRGAIHPAEQRVLYELLEKLRRKQLY